MRRNSVGRIKKCNPYNLAYRNNDALEWLYERFLAVGNNKKALVSAAARFAIRFSKVV